jgi:hypothetical protein
LGGKTLPNLVWVVDVMRTPMAKPAASPCAALTLTPVDKRCMACDCKRSALLLVVCAAWDATLVIRLIMESDGLRAAICRHY